MPPLCHEEGIVWSGWRAVGYVALCQTDHVRERLTHPDGASPPGTQSGTDCPAGCVHTLPHTGRVGRMGREQKHPDDSVPVQVRVSPFAHGPRGRGFGRVTGRVVPTRGTSCLSPYVRRAIRLRSVQHWLFPTFRRS